MYHILAADIGGTHCRLAYFTGNSPHLLLQNTRTLPTAAVPHTAALLAAFAALCPDRLPLSAVDMLSVAVAGPLLDPMRARTSNAALEIRMDEVAACGVRATLLCNDFAAQAWACCSPAVDDALCVLAGVPPHSDAPPRPVGVIGAGTGLGVASVLPLPQGGHMVVPSEAGHTPFAFNGDGQRGQTERAYDDFVRRTLEVPYVTADMVLSGRGLCLLHQFLSGQRLSAPEIAARHLQEHSATCQYFATFLGRMCRQWVLSTLCAGGLYITGGVAMKNPVLVHCPAFAEAFVDSSTFGDFLRTVPVFLNTNADSGLWGAAWAGVRALRGGDTR